MISATAYYNENKNAGVFSPVSHVSMCLRTLSLWIGADAAAVEGVGFAVDDLGGVGHHHAAALEIGPVVPDFLPARHHDAVCAQVVPIAVHLVPAGTYGSQWLLVPDGVNYRTVGITNADQRLFVFLCPDSTHRSRSYNRKTHISRCW